MLPLVVADQAEIVVDVSRVTSGCEVLGGELLEPVPVEGVLQVFQGQGVVENVNGRLKHQVLHLGPAPYRLARRPPLARSASCADLPIFWSARSTRR